MFRIAYTSSALDDIEWFLKRDRKTIFDETEDRLTHQPNVETRNRKRLRPNQVAEWELRIGEFRVFYDVDTEANVVEVKMVGYKERNNCLRRARSIHYENCNRVLAV